MPNRLLKEGIVDSDRINALSADAEVTFYRLLVVADDLGRMDARIPILRARCFPLKDAPGLLIMIGDWLDELAAVGLISRYVVGGQPYLQIENWSQRVRSQGKYPPPTDGQLIGACLLDDGQLTVKRQTGAGHISDTCPPSDGLGKGMGKGMGASNANSVRFDAANGAWSVPDVLQNQWRKAFQIGRAHV